MDYQKLIIKKYPQINDKKDSAETAVLVKETAAINSICFSNESGHVFAVAASTRVQIYSKQSNSVKKTISRFQHVVYDASFRKDGRLICAADGSGLVQVFDLNSRAILRSFSGHEGAARVSKFLSSGTQLISAGNDKTCRLWDIATQEQVSYWKEHEDYIRTACVSLDNPQLFFTGSYDHTIKLWDSRVPDRSALTIKNIGNPVECVQVFPRDSVIVAGCGNNLMTWDVLGASSGNLLSSNSNHQKTITSLAFDSSFSRILAGSLDHHVKVYDVSDYHVTHSFRYPEAVLSVGLSPDDSHVIAGMNSGLLSIREKTSHSTEESQKEMESDLYSIVTKKVPQSSHERDMMSKHGSQQYFLRGIHKPPSENDIVIESEKRPKQARFEKHLRSFEYSAALDAALTTFDMGPVVVVSLLEELRNRGDGLEIALAQRDEETLEVILSFILRHIVKPKFADILIHVLDLLLDIYSLTAQNSPLIARIFQKISYKTRDELILQTDLQKMLGSLELLISSSQK